MGNHSYEYPQFKRLHYKFILHSYFYRLGGLNMADNVTINIYGGNNQVIPDVKEVEQHIYTEDGETIVINKFKVK